MTPLPPALRARLEAIERLCAFYLADDPEAERACDLIPKCHALVTSALALVRADPTPAPEASIVKAAKAWGIAQSAINASFLGDPQLADAQNTLWTAESNLLSALQLTAAEAPPPAPAAREGGTIARGLPCRCPAEAHQPCPFTDAECEARAEANLAHPSLGDA